MQVDCPCVVAEVTAAFDAYEAALVNNDIRVLNDLFWNDARALRYGVAEVQHGHAEIGAYRRTRPAQSLERTLLHTVVTTFGRDFAVVNTQFRLRGDERTGRQSQTWARTPDGWRIVAAHVSMQAPP